MEIVAAIIGLVFIMLGVVMLTHPDEITFTPTGGGRGLGPNKSVHYSKTGTQIVGGLSVAMGAGFGCLALYPGRKK